jgi:hydroxyacylglutathione hydrolase
MGIGMHVEQIRTGGDRNFGYIIADAGHAAFVDPSYDPARMARMASEWGYDVEYILTTHGHDDHTNGNEEAVRLTDARVVAHESSPIDADIRVAHGDTLPLGNLMIHVIHTPGHTPDHVCYLVEDTLFTGDTLFVGKVGGTDTDESAHREYDSLHQLLMLPEETRVLPGHDVGVQPESTIGNESRTDPFLLQPDFDTFLDLKKNWTEYKRIHGIT